MLKFLKFVSPYLIIIFLFNIIEWISIYESIYLSNSLGYSFLILSIIFGLSAFFRVLVEIPTGILWDNIWHKFNIIIGSLLVGLGYLAVISWNIFLVIFGMILVAIWDAFWNSSLNASAVEYIKYNWHYDIEKFFTIKNLIVSLGYLVWVSINMILIKFLKLDFIFIFGFILSIVISILAYKLVPWKIVNKDDIKIDFKKYKRDFVDSYVCFEYLNWMILQFYIFIF